MSFAPVAPSVAPKAARSRLRSPAIRSGEFVHPACLDWIAELSGGPRSFRAHSGSWKFPRDRPQPAPCRGWPASDPGRPPPGPWFLTGVFAVVSGVKRDFACTLTGAFPPVLVVLRELSRLRLEGRARSGCSGPSPGLSRVMALAGPDLNAVTSGVLHGYGLACPDPGTGSSLRAWREETRWVTATPATSSAAVQLAKTRWPAFEVQGAALIPATRMIFAEAGIRPDRRGAGSGLRGRGRDIQAATTW